LKKIRREVHLSAHFPSFALFSAETPALPPNQNELPHSPVSLFRPGIIGQIRDEACKNGASPSKESVFQYFVSKCANNLHIVLAMSPVGDTLRTRCRNFPGLVNNAIIDWFMPWPEQALFAVSTSFLSRENEFIPKGQKENLVSHMVMVHQSVEHYSEQFAAKLRRKNYTTPKNYLDFIDTYLRLLGTKDRGNRNQQERLNIGM
jgi:dynein heavy chain